MTTDLKGIEIADPSRTLFRFEWHKDIQQTIPEGCKTVILPGHKMYRAFFTSRRQSDPVSLRRTIICFGKLQARDSMCCRHRRLEF